jgi:hypothetical protein
LPLIDLLAVQVFDEQVKLLADPDPAASRLGLILVEPRKGAGGGGRSP